ncbi:hypothetical protein SAY87_000044 [Trapa incisa]|uniref:Major facilitator superfamily (MFS) profile domain-containing protein n=1 Tax=Trapa incisa TaxID=236973 RepID=A0AAN7JGV6_9MYRT|nr:hypothetical protein SAY87_000044 [Trapa incisa]
MSRHGLSSFRGTPPGVLLIRRLRGGKDLSLTTYRYVVLLIIFIAYACYHASRKPSSIVKSVLYPEHAPNSSSASLPWPLGAVFIQDKISPETSGDDSVRSSGWAPFNEADGTSKLGEIDVAFLACYSLGMYVAGHLGDTLDLRLFLTFGMMGSGIFVGLFGMGYFWNLHMVAGMFQATGWPSVVAVIGNWFGKWKRGLIMGVWNAHTSVGNISGSLLAAAVLDHGWGWSFIVPGALIVLGGILVYLFLAAYPEDIGFPCANSSSVSDEHSCPEDMEAQAQKGNASIMHHSVSISSMGSGRKRSVGLIEACRIPGVMSFALCLFFSKLVAYTFLYWLPFYLSQTGRPPLSSSDLLMMVVDLFVNGPYALITTAVSADLGTHASLRGDSRALATVTAIIDGTGSVGAALGPLLTGFISKQGWDAVFQMLVLLPDFSYPDLLLKKYARSFRN